MDFRELTCQYFGRGVQNASIMLNGFENYFVEIIVLPVLLSGVIIIGMTLLVAARFSLVRHPAFIIAILVNLSPPILQSFPELVTPINELVKAIFTLRFEGTTF